MSKIDRYIDNILAYVELNDENKNDIKEEIKFHINKKAEVYEKEGYEKGLALETAIADFGESNKVGKKLNRDLFPFRKFLLNLNGVLSIFFALLVCIISYIYHDTIPYIWFPMTLIFSSVILYFAQKPSKFASNRSTLIFLLLLLFLFSFYGFILVDTLRDNPLLFYGILTMFIFNSIIIFSQIYMGAMFQPVNTHIKLLTKNKRRITLITNIITGIIVVGYAFILIGGYLIFAPTTIPKLALFLILSWFILFYSHLKFKKTENVSRFLMIVLATSIIAWNIFILNWF